MVVVSQYSDSEIWGPAAKGVQKGRLRGFVYLDTVRRFKGNDDL